MKLWPVKFQPGTPMFGNANPDNPTALRLRQRGHEISDGIDEMGGIVVRGPATGAVMAVGAGRAHAAVAAVADALVCQVAADRQGPEGSVVGLVQTPLARKS